MRQKYDAQNDDEVLMKKKKKNSNACILQNFRVVVVRIIWASVTVFVVMIVIEKSLM